MKSRLEEIKANHEFRKGEGWEVTTLPEDIDWLIEELQITKNNYDMLWKDHRYLIKDFEKMKEKVKEALTDIVECSDIETAVIEIAKNALKL